jgi:hypothetical protein
MLVILSLSLNQNFYAVTMLWIHRHLIMNNWLIVCVCSLEIRSHVMGTTCHLWLMQFHASKIFDLARSHKRLLLYSKSTPPWQCYLNVESLGVFPSFLLWILFFGFLVFDILIKMQTQEYGQIIYIIYTNCSKLMKSKVNG